MLKFLWICWHGLLRYRKEDKISLSILIPCKEEPNVTEVIRECEINFPEAKSVVCNDREGRGKGWAVREALKHADSEWVCFIDGDMDIHPRMIRRLIPFTEDYDIILGKKQIRGSLTRRLVTRVSRLVIRTLFAMDYDTQTGIKLFKRESIPEWDNDEYMFDLEIISKAHDAGFKIIEVPVEVTPYGSTSKTLRGKNIIRCFLETLKIWRKRI